jgi:hypothetical protein
MNLHISSVWWRKSMMPPSSVRLGFGFSVAATAGRMIGGLGVGMRRGVFISDTRSVTPFRFILAMRLDTALREIPSRAAISV